MKDRIIHYGDQNTKEWERLKIGRFSSSTMNQLFTKPSKQSKSKSAMRGLQLGEWELNDEILQNRPNNDELNHCIKYLLDFGLGKKAPLMEAKKELKKLFKESYLSIDNLDLFQVSEAATLLMRGAYAIDHTDPLEGTAVGLSRKKAIEVIYDTLGPDIGNTPACNWGNINEPLALQKFEERTCLFLDEGKDKIQFIEMCSASGSSPDGSIFAENPIEVKCPHSMDVHFAHCGLRNGLDLFNYSKQKYYQVQHQILALRADFGYWASFDPRLLRKELTAPRALHIIKVKPHKKTIDAMQRLTDNAIRLRDKFINDFIKYNDFELWQ
jgi:hypothetical protein